MGSKGYEESVKSLQKWRGGKAFNVRVVAGGCGCPVGALYLSYTMRVMPEPLDSVPEGSERCGYFCGACGNACWGTRLKGVKK